MDEEALEGVLDKDYEEVVEFECPICGTRVTQEATACPGCGAIFVTPEQKEQEALQAMDADIRTDAGDEDDLSLELEAEEGYELDDGLGTEVAAADEDELNDEEIDAELRAMEADLEREVAEAPIEVDVRGVDPINLDLGYEEDDAVEEESERHYGRAVAVTADDHDALVELAQPTFVETLFSRMGIGLFLVGGAMSLLVLMWDPINGQPVALGSMQLNLLVFSLALFIVGFAVEMLQAISLARHDEVLFTA